MKFSMKLISLFLLFTFLLLNPQANDAAEGCTTAIIHGSASANGCPILWKNRDTDFLSNKVVYVAEAPYSYIGLVNAQETSGRFVYAGLNSQGFAIINSVAYNLPSSKSDEMKDLEGLNMAEALRTCRTAGDFESFIKKNLGPSMGSWANYGVIDSEGQAVIFEVHNHGYQKYDTQDTPEKYLINTNFARSGKADEGTGYLRFERATELFKKIPPGQVNHQVILSEISRDFGHTLLAIPSLQQLKKQSVKQPAWILTRDMISRTPTSAAIVICGKKAGDPDSIATFWIIPGEPVTGIAVPLWVEAGETPTALGEGEEAPLFRETMRLKKIIRPYSQRDKAEYMQATLLVNKERTGFLPRLLAAEAEIFAAAAAFLQTSHSKEEFAAFQDQLARKALQTLESIH